MTLRNYAVFSQTRLAADHAVTTSKSRARKLLRILEKPLRRNPLLGMIALILLLFTSILIGSQVRRPIITDEAVQSEPKVVPIFYVGELPSVTVSGRVEQTGVVQILAQSAGVVQEVSVKPGQSLKAGQRVARLSTAYSGASAPSVQRSIAAKQYEQAQQNRELQLQALELQQNLTTTSAVGAQRQREIQAAALGDTRQVLELTELQLQVLDESLAVATASADLQQLRQQRAQLLSTATQLRGSIRNMQYLDSPDNPPAQLETLQKELTLKQLEIQKRSLELSEDVARLQLQLARIQEAALFPSVPFAGVIERVHVSKGQTVSPVQLIATLKCDELATQVTALVSPVLARQLSTLQPATLQSGETSITLYPQYISTVATEGSLHTVQFSIPKDHFYAFTNSDVVRVTLPLYAPASQTTTPYIPIDSVYQTENQAIVLVVSADGRAESREITTGVVSGRFVSVLSGLDATAQVILDRSIVAGERVLPENDAVKMSQKE